MAKEKMVPLDVTGNPVEVTLKDEDIKEEVPVEESNIREIVEEETPQEVETKEEPKEYPPKNSWGMIKPPETTQKEWVEGYKAWKEKQ